MALRYFDRNGTTAGFGTLTGAWDTTTASWSDNAAGTATPTTFTFTDADQAQFGAVGATATAGTATIAASLNVTVNQIITANIAAAQTIAAGAGGSLTLAGTTPTINVGSAGGLTISALIEGTSGFTKSGTGTLTLSSSNTGLVGGTVTVSDGILVAGTPDFSTALNAMPNITTLALTGANAVAGIQNTVSATINYDITVSNAAAYANVGTFSTSSANAQTLAGTNSGAGSLRVQAPITGLAAATRFSRAQASTLPNKLWFLNNGTNANIRRAIFDWTGAAATPGTDIRLDINNASQTSWAWGLFNKGAGEVEFGNVSKETSGSATIAAIWNVGEAGDTADIKIAGVISQVDAGALSITKEGSRKLTLSGANTYTGTTTVTAGTLSAQSAGALGTTGAVTVSGTGTLDISEGVSVTKSGTALTLGGTGSPQLSSTTGSNIYNCAGVTLNTTLPVSVAAGAYLKLNNSTAMTGAFGLTKSDDGELDLGTTNNNYTGAVTVSAGTLTVGSLRNAGTASSLGTGALTPSIVLAGTLKYAGTSAASTSRSLTLTGASPAIEAAGTTAAAAVTFSAYTHAAGARTLMLKGDNTGNNTLATALADNGASVVGLTKQGAGKWILSAQPTYSGVTTVSAGELQFNGLNLNSNLTMNGTGVLSNTVIAGTSKTITCDGGTPEIVATTTGNTVTGTTSVSTGTLRLTTEQFASSKPVKVLGDTAVSVSGALRTTVGATQRGQMRYGGNLTFNSGSALYIG